MIRKGALLQPRITSYNVCYTKLLRINRAHILADGERITLADLPPDIARSVHYRETAGIEFASTGGLREQLRRIEAEIIARALRDAGGDRRLAAQRLDIGLSSLYRKLEEMEAQGAGRNDGPSKE